jgi:oligosaccharide reducing-end xylanase
MRIGKKIKMGIAALSTAAMILPASSYAAGNDNSNQPTPPGIGANPSSGAYQTGVYPNLFKEAGYSQDQIDAKVNDAWNKFFHGDATNQTIYYERPNGQAYIKDIGDNDVRTEGIGYGMMIAVQLNHKDEFDKLWNFAKTNMLVNSGSTKNYFAWHTDTNGNVIDYGIAPDGDQWIAAALAFASDRFGNGTGIYNYKQEAKQILHAMWHNSDEGGIDMFSHETYLPTFSPPYAINFTDPSYSLPAFYKIFALVDSSDKDLWNKAYTAGEKLLQDAPNPNTGLVADYSNWDGTPYFSPGEIASDTAYDHNFQYDAFRAIANANMDAAWFGVKPWQTNYSNTLEKFFWNQGINKYETLYHVDGTPTSKGQHSTGLVAMNAASAISATYENKLDFVKALWNTNAPTGQWRYYDGVLYTLGLLYTSGDFKIWYGPYDDRQYTEAAQK